MSVLSKLLCEYIVVTDVNDKFRAVRTSPSETKTITLTAGRYRDHVSLATEIQTQLNAAAWTPTAPTWVVVVSNAGIVSIDADEAWTMDWNTTSYGTTLRDDLGFAGTETVDAVTYTLEATSIHLGGFYPSQPVENDDRPYATGSNRWDNDAVQQVGRSGVAATTGGANRVGRRSVQFLLTNDDCAKFSTWMQRVGQGYSFAFYHDKTVAWPGSSGEYGEFKQRIDGDAGSSYDPERVDPANSIWHRAKLVMLERVAPTP